MCVRMGCITLSIRRMCGKAALRTEGGGGDARHAAPASLSGEGLKPADQQLQR